MRIFLLLGVLVMLTAATCKNKKSTLAPNCFKGKLEIKANCMNYTIGLVQGNMDTSLLSANWTDESTGKTYKNVFALGSRCTFPASLQQGDEFYFTIDSSSVQNCAVCLMYYPVPPKHLSIKVIPGPCTP